VTEKDVALEAQREINKALIVRTADMEALLAQLQESHTTLPLPPPLPQ
jgi:hypothetical protein